MTAAKQKVSDRFCGHCSVAVTNGRAHKSCPGDDACSCARAGHRPSIELGRRMLTSQCPDRKKEIARGDFDAKLFFPV